MDSQTPNLDFAVIGHQDSWRNIKSFVNNIREVNQEKLSLEEVRSIFSFIPPRDLFRVKVKSKTGIEINGVYIETFIDPDKLDVSSIRVNIKKVINAIQYVKKLGAKIATLGGFTSIVLEGNIESFSKEETKFTTGNTLTSAFIVKGIEKAADQINIKLNASNLLIIGATGDIGMACTSYLKDKVKNLLLCARNIKQLENLAGQLANEHLNVKHSILLDELIPDADIILCVASSKNLKISGCKKNVIICDAGYPKNLETKIEDNHHVNLFHGGMGQVSHGFTFNPDYTNSFYQFPAPYIIHGCILEAMVLAFENKIENYSLGKGNIKLDKIEEIYNLSIKHGINIAPFFNANGLW